VVGHDQNDMTIRLVDAPSMVVAFWAAGAASSDGPVGPGHQELLGVNPQLSELNAVPFRGLA
jgi:hypothetical protein